MSKILSSWSAMRKYLENEMLAECLRGRIRYHCTTYPNMDGMKIFEVFADGQAVKRFSWETVNSYFIKNGICEKPQPMTKTEYWDGFHENMKRIPKENRTEYTDEEFCAALEQYRNQDIQKSLYSDDAIVRMFAILDRRVGKRTLSQLANHTLAPVWLNQFLDLRMKEDE